MARARIHDVSGFRAQDEWDSRAQCRAPGFSCASAWGMNMISAYALQSINAYLVHSPILRDHARSAAAARARSAARRRSYTRKPVCPGPSRNRSRTRCRNPARRRRGNRPGWPSRRRRPGSTRGCSRRCGAPDGGRQIRLELGVQREDTREPELVAQHLQARPIGGRIRTKHVEASKVDDRARMSDHLKPVVLVSRLKKSESLSDNTI